MELHICLIISHVGVNGHRLDQQALDSLLTVINGLSNDVVSWTINTLITVRLSYYCHTFVTNINAGCKSILLFIALKINCLALERDAEFIHLIELVGDSHNCM